MKQKLIAISLFMALLVSAYAQQKTKPNFIIVLGDDISEDAIGCYGSSNKGTTPNIDKLSEKGVMFTNMFVSEAICAPTRAELYTGRQPYRNGCTSNSLPTNKNIKSVVHYMGDLGYRVALAGKKHYRPKSVYPFRYIKGFTEAVKTRGPYLTEDWDALKNFINEDREKPFCLYLCSVNAHSPWDAGNSDLWKQNDLVLPKHFVDTRLTRHYYREYLGEVNLFDKQVGKMVNLMKNLKLTKNTILIVLDENGAGMPRGKWTDYDWGVRSSCVMKWPKEYNVKSRSKIGALTQYCDILPTMIDVAGGTVPVEMDGKSLLGLLRGKIQKTRDYIYFVYNEYYKSRAVLDGRYKLIWNITYNDDYHINTINGWPNYKDWMLDRDVHFMYLSWLQKSSTDKNALRKLNLFLKHPEYELYDLEKDPDELNNLISDKSLKSKVDDLKSHLVGWMEKQGDTKYLKQ